MGRRSEARELISFDYFDSFWLRSEEGEKEVIKGETTMQHKAHKLIRIRMGNDYLVYKCTLPGCKFFKNAQLIHGNLALCWMCGREFVMGFKSAQLKKPHCPECKRQVKLVGKIEEEVA